MIDGAPCPDDEALARYVHRARAGLPDDVDRHLADCAECRHVVFAVACDTLGSEGERRPEPVRPRALGRYQLDDVIGAGGMGLVFSALDPALGRRVAIKVLRRAPSPGDAAQLLGEARALARLSHPNVVTVHDVGEHDGEVFLAMEQLDAHDLDAWRRERPRSWREVVAVMVGVADGLAAAHEAGMVHGDVKPANVLVTGAGRACLTDFGLAALAEPVDGESDPTDGRIVGTPAYMAPELLAGARADRSSDVFGFGATLYEALFGRRPFDGASLAELAAAMEAPIAVPRRPRVPRALAALVERSLARERGRRPASADQIARQLRRLLGARRRRITAAAAALAVAAGASTSLLWPAGDPCRGAAAPAARVWTAERRGQVERAIGATAAPYAEDTWRRVAGLIDGYAAWWSSMRVGACRATHVDRTQSTELLDRRVACLDRRLVELDAAIDALAAIERTSVSRAIEIAAHLPSLSGCADAETLLALTPPPSDPAVAAQVGEVERTIARAHALEAAGALEAARRLAEKAADAAADLSYPPLEAAALIQLGSVQDVQFDLDAARDSLRRAVAAAAAGRDVRAEITALAALSGLLIKTSSDRKVAEDNARHAVALLGQIGDDPALAASAHMALASVLHEQADPDARAALEQARAALSRIAEQEPSAPLRVEFASLESTFETDLAKSLARLEQTRRAVAAAYGDRHPEVGALWLEMAVDYRLSGAIEEARRAAERAAEILGPSPRARSLVNLVAADAEKNHARRATLLEAVVRDGEATWGRDHRLVGVALYQLADTLLSLDRLDEAAAAAERAAAIDARVDEDVGDARMIPHLALQALIELGRNDMRAAEKSAERALELAGTIDEPSWRIAAEIALAAVRSEQGRCAEALPVLEKHSAIYRLALWGDAAAVASYDYTMAACQWEVGRDRPAALARVRAARATIAADENPWPGVLRDIDRWLRDRR